MGTPASFNNLNPAYGGASGMGAGSLPELPNPAQMAPDVVNATGSGGGSTCPAPKPPCVNGPMLHTHSVAMADSMAAIPSPKQIAPHLFFNNPPAKPAGAQQPAPAQQQPRAPQPQQPPPQQAQQQPQQAPQQQQQAPQQPQQKAPQPQPQNQPAQPKAPVDDLDGAFSDAVVKNLNRQLNDQDEGTRATAATDFCNIMQKHPQLAENPAYKKYVDAFTEKIMADPSSLVRGVGEMTLQLGMIKNPSDPVRSHLKTLAMKDDASLTKENDQASSILTGLENGSLGSDVSAPDKKNSATPGEVASSPTGSGADPKSGAGPGQAGANPTDSKGLGNASSQTGSQAGTQTGKDAAAASQTPGQTPGQTSGATGGAASTPTPDPTPAPTGADPAGGVSGNTPDATGQAGTPPGQDAQAAQASGAGQTPQDAAAGAGSATAGNTKFSSNGGRQAGSSNDSSSTSGGGLGHRLNLWSQAPKSFLPSWMQPHTGQKMNMVEGPTS
jgi:hypothetical protein